MPTVAIEMHEVGDHSQPDPNEPLTWSKEQFLETAEFARVNARNQFLSRGQHRPMAIVFATKHPRTGAPGRHPIMVPALGDFDQADKNMFAGILRGVAHASAAVGIIFISECWMLQGADDGVLSKWTGRIDEHPERREYLMATCEHVRFGCQMWVSEILRKEGQSLPELGPWTTHGRATKHDGRFVHLLPQVD